MPAPRAPVDFASAAVGLITVIAANFLYLSGLQQVLDPMMSMEPLYIRMAQQPVSDILRWPAAWGPLYALWLKPLVAVFEDPVVVYTANVRALSFGVSIVLYLHVLALTRRAAPAAAAALFLLVSDFNVPLAGKVSAFALMVSLAGLTVAQLAAPGARRLAIAAGGVLLASYARPELYAPALCLGAASLWRGYGEHRAVGSRGLLWPCALVAWGMALALGVGVPTYGSDRLFIAFREHFAWNWSRWHGEGRTFLAIWQETFGDAHSILQALVNNPGAVVRHVLDNLLGTAGFMVASTFDHYPLLAPVTQEMLVRAESLAAAACAFGCILYAAGRHEPRRRLCERHGQTLFSYAVIALFSLGSASVIFPVPHYLVVPGVLLIVTAALAAAAIVPPTSGDSWRWRAGSALVCLAAIPRPFVLPSTYEAHGLRFQSRIVVERRVVDTIELIRSLGLAPPVRVLTTTDGVGEMLGGGFQEVKVWQKGSRPLRNFMRDNDVGVIVNLEGGRDSFMVDDPHWQLLHNDPAAAGFVRVRVPGHDAVHVYVRANLPAR